MKNSNYSSETIIWKKTKKQAKQRVLNAIQRRAQLLLIKHTKFFPKAIWSNSRTQQILRQIIKIPNQRTSSSFQSNISEGSTADLNAKTQIRDARAHWSEHRRIHKRLSNPMLSAEKLKQNGGLRGHQQLAGTEGEGEE